MPSIPHEPVVLVVVAETPNSITDALTLARSLGCAPAEIRVVCTPRAAQHVAQVVLGCGRTAGTFRACCRRLGIRSEDIVFNRGTLHVVRRDEHEEGGQVSALEDRDRLLAAVLRPKRQLQPLWLVIAPAGGWLGALTQAVHHPIAGPEDRLFVLESAGDDLQPLDRPGVRRHVTAATENDRPEFPGPTPFRLIELPLVAASVDDWNRADEGVAALRQRRWLEWRSRRNPEPLTIDVRTHTIFVAHLAVRLTPLQFFWYCYFATTTGERFPLNEFIGHVESAGDGAAVLRASVRSRPDRVRVQNILDSLNDLFVSLFPHRADMRGETIARSCGISPTLPSTVARVGRALKKVLGPAALPYPVEGGRGAGGYRLTLPASKIRVTRAFFAPTEGHRPNQHPLAHEGALQKSP